MGYMLVTQSTEGFRNNRAPGMLRLKKCTKEEATAFAKAVFDQIVEQENRVMISHDWDEQKGVGVVKYYGGDEARMNLFDFVCSDENDEICYFIFEEFK